MPASLTRSNACGCGINERKAGIINPHYRNAIACYNNSMHKPLLTLILLLPLLAVSETKPVLVVVSEVWPPYVTGEAELPGFDVEISRHILSAMGYRMDLQLMPWRRALVNVERGEADAILDAFDNPERRQQLHYPSEPLSVSTSSLFCYRCAHDRTPSLDELVGVQIAVNRGYQYSETFDSHLGPDRVEVDSFEQGFRLLERGRVDFYAVNERVGQYTLSQLGQTEVRALSPPIAPVEPVYLIFAAKPGYDSLAAEFGKLLTEFKQIQAYQRIMKRYQPHP